MITTVREVRGPTAFGDDWARFWALTWRIAITEFKLRFFGSVLGYLWQLMRPLLLFGVLYIVFAVILKAGGGEPRFGVALLLGIVVFQYFSDATALAVKSLVMSESLIRKVDFPRAVVPAACSLQAFLNFLLNLVPVLVFLFAAGGTLTASWLLIPFVIAPLVLFVSGMCFFLSASYVVFRDTDPIWDVVIQGFFYATPILYSLSVVQEKLGNGIAQLMLISPLATAIQALRHLMVSQEYESPLLVFSSPWGVLLPILVALACFAVGCAVFSASTPSIAEKL